jgi:hypothetical protein
MSYHFNYLIFEIHVKAGPVILQFASQWWPRQNLKVSPIHTITN